MLANYYKQKMAKQKKYSQEYKKENQDKILNIYIYIYIYIYIMTSKIYYCKGFFMGKKKEEKRFLYYSYSTVINICGVWLT